MTQGKTMSTPDSQVTRRKIKTKGIKTKESLQTNSSVKVTNDMNRQD